MAKISQIAPVDWKTELKAAAFKYHVLIAWVAVALNPIWAIGDYFNSPHHFTDFLIFRITVAVLTLIVVLMKNKFLKYPEIIAFIPFIGISVQNAYMFSVLNVSVLMATWHTNVTS